MPQICHWHLRIPLIQNYLVSLFMPYFRHLLLLILRFMNALHAIWVAFFVVSMVVLCQLLETPDACFPYNVKEHFHFVALYFIVLTGSVSMGELAILNSSWQKCPIHVVALFTVMILSCSCKFIELPSSFATKVSSIQSRIVLWFPSQPWNNIAVYNVNASSISVCMDFIVNTSKYAGLSESRFHWRITSNGKYFSSSFDSGVWL